MGGRRRGRALHFTHVAEHMAKVALRNSVLPAKTKIRYDNVPWVTYTDPEVAHVGLSEDEATDGRRHDVTYRYEMDDLDRAIVDGSAVGFVKVSADRKGKVIGATIVAHGAGDLIMPLVLAKQHGLSLSKVANTIFPYPTMVEGVKRASGEFMRSRLDTAGGTDTQANHPMAEIETTRPGAPDEFREPEAASGRGPTRGRRADRVPPEARALLVGPGRRLPDPHAGRRRLAAYLTREGIGDGIEWLRGNPWAPSIFVGIYATATALAVPGHHPDASPGAPSSASGGAPCYNFIAANIGANAAFSSPARWAGTGTAPHGKDSKVLEKLDNVVEQHGFRGLLTLRLIPLVPFNALNFGSGLMPLRWRTYAVATLMGIVPGTAVYTFFADALLQGSQEASRDAWLRVFVAGAPPVLLSFLPAILKRMNVRLPGMVNHSRPALQPAVVAMAGFGRSAAQSRFRQQLPDHAEFTGGAGPGRRRTPGVDYARLAGGPVGLGPTSPAGGTTDISGAVTAPPRRAAGLLDQRLQRLHAEARDRALSDQEGRRLSRGMKNAAAGRPGQFGVADRRRLHRRPLPGGGGWCARRTRSSTRSSGPWGIRASTFAINCAARQLSAADPHGVPMGGARSMRPAGRPGALAFVSDPAHFRGGRPTGRRQADRARQQPCCDWFKEDFGGRPRAFGPSWRGTPQGECQGGAPRLRARELVFFDYDWTLNDTAR